MTESADDAGEGSQYPWGMGGQQGQLSWRRALSLPGKEHVFLRRTEDSGQAKTFIHMEGD